MNDEVRNYTAIVWMHARPIGVKDTRHLDSEPILAIVVEEKRFGAAFSFVITRTESDRIHITPIIFALRVDFGVTVYLAGRSLEYLRLDPLGQSQHVDCAMDTRLGRLDWVVLVVDRRCWTREVIDFVDLDIKRKGDVVPNDFKVSVAN